MPYKKYEDETVIPLNNAKSYVSRAVRGGDVFITMVINQSGANRSVDVVMSVEQALEMSAALNFYARTAGRLVSK